MPDFNHYLAQGRFLQSVSQLVPSPTITHGVDKEIDVVCLEHFHHDLSHRFTLSTTEKSNPFQRLFLTMAFEHEGLMRLILSLAGRHHYRCYGKIEFIYRALEQYDLAVQYLRKETAAIQVHEIKNSYKIEDAMVASWLVQCLICVCDGSTKGEYRPHMNVTRNSLDNHYSKNPEFNSFHEEYFKYHEFASLITSYDPDAIVEDLNDDFWQLDEDHHPSMSPDGYMIGVYDGLLEFVPKIRNIRNQLRRGSRNEQDLKIKITKLEVAIVSWTPMYRPHSPNWYAALLYQHMILVYLYRTFLPSRPCHTFETSVNKGLDCLEAIAPDSPAQSNALLPLFILGCASFNPQQRLRVRNGLDRVCDYAHFGNIQSAQVVVEEIWRLMDKEDENSWDWEKLMWDMGIDCLMT